MTHPPGRTAIVVHGLPIPQGSKVANRFGGGVRDTNAKRLKAWRDQVKAIAADTCRYHDQLTGPVKIWVHFTFTRPPAHYRTGRNSALLRDSAPPAPIGADLGDVDKLQRAIFDALTDAGVWVDDRLVVDVRARKVYAGEDEHALDRAGVTVVLEDLTPQTATAAASPCGSEGAASAPGSPAGAGAPTQRAMA